MVRARLLDGAKAVIDRLEMFAEVSISKDQVYRWAKREEDPLPLIRHGRLRRPRIVADPFRLEAWARREWPER